MTMRKKTLQHLQFQGEKLETAIDERICELRKEIQRLESRKSKVEEFLYGLDDPHALIPKWYSSLDEWIEDSTFPYSCIGMVYRNKRHAERVSLCCYTYQDDYKVVRCEPKEYYKLKYNIK